MNKLTPEQHIKKAILLKAKEWNEDIEFIYEDEEVAYELTSENIDDLYDIIKSSFDEIYDAEEEVRCGGEDTNVTSKSSSRHYECDEVGFEVEKGIWVGWTYWYGGGKHGEPSGIDWMDEAYFLNVKEEEKVVVVREFSRQS